MTEISSIQLFLLLAFLVLLQNLTTVLSASCINPREPFPAPRLKPGSDAIQSLFSGLETKLAGVLNGDEPPWNTTITSFAIEVTSADETLWQSYRTAPLLGDYPDSEPVQVDGAKAFRIASISKVFTVLAILRLDQDDELSIKDPVVRWIPELARGTNEGGIAWEKITLESLASQLSGLPRECMSNLLQCRVE